MHRVLYMQEILLNIFGYCYKHVDHGWCIGKRNLIALARTCRAFKEPALDILWAELEDLAPLVRCLPEASCLSSHRVYSLNRPLEQADWDVILGYTRRVRICHVHGSSGLAADCVEEISQPPNATSSIFPKLSEIDVQNPEQEIASFLQHLTGPRLTVLRFKSYMQGLGDAVYAFGERCPNIMTFVYSSTRTGTNPDKISGLICQWPKLRSVQCVGVALNVAAFIHLSHMQNLDFLTLELHDAVIDRIRSTQPNPSVLTFPVLVYHKLHSRSLATVCRFFDHLRLPATEQLHVDLQTHPTVLEFTSFLAALPATCNHQSLIDIEVHVLGFEMHALYAEFVPDSPPYQINFYHLYPLTVFVNIQAIYLDLPCGVDLSEPELLQLASSWPHLQIFAVGWGECQCTASSAITPGGFVQLLERCKSLSRFSFLFNIHGYTEIPRGHPWRGLEMMLDNAAIIDVRKSPIEEESIEALAIFFHVAPFPEFHLKNTWDDYSYRTSERFDLAELYGGRWSRVSSLARKLWEERENLLDSLESRGRIAATHTNGHDSDSDDDDTDVD